MTRRLIVFLNVAILGSSLAFMGVGCSPGGGEGGQTIELPAATKPAESAPPAADAPVDPNTSQGAPNTP